MKDQKFNTVFKLLSFASSKIGFWTRKRLTIDTDLDGLKVFSGHWNWGGETRLISIFCNKLEVGQVRKNILMIPSHERYIKLFGAT